jgi:hypothetical protein
MSSEFDRTFEEMSSTAMTCIRVASAVSGLCGLIAGTALGAMAAYTDASRERTFEEADDLVLVDALTREPAKTLLKKGYATPDQIRDAAEKGIHDLANTANTAFSSTENTKETARQAVTAYLADKSISPVVKIPVPTAP